MLSWLWELSICSILIIVCVETIRVDDWKDISKNLFGKCALVEVNHFSLLVPDSYNQVSLLWEPAGESERTEFMNLPNTLTQANDKLALGISNGSSVLTEWAKLDSTWQFPERHPRRNRTLCQQYNNASVALPLAHVYSRDYLVPFYLLAKRNALVHPTGIVASACGYHQALDGCETKFKFIGRKWYNMCSSQLKRRRISWDQALQPSSPLLEPIYTSNTSKPLEYPLCRNPGEGNYSFVPQLFVASSIWDHNYHHLLVEILPRIIRHLPFLLSHAEVKIHLRASERSFEDPMAVHSAGLIKRRVFELLGLPPSRFVNGPVIAQEVYIPRTILCTYSNPNALEVRQVMKQLSAAAKEDRPFIVVGDARHPMTLWQPASAKANEQKDRLPQVIILPHVIDCHELSIPSAVPEHNYPSASLPRELHFS